MPPKTNRLGNWNSNGRLSIYLFLLVFGTYIVLDIVSIAVKGPAPDGLIPIVTAAFGFAVTMNSADRRTEERAKERRTQAIEDRSEATEHRADDLEDYAVEANPDIAQRTIKRKKSGDSHDDG